MDTYLLRRRGIAADARELDAALTRLRAFEELPKARAARWLHSYALREADGRFGLACVFEADGVQSLREHALATRLPAEEVVRVTATLVERAFAPALVHLVRRGRAWLDAAGFDAAVVDMRRIAADPSLSRRLSWLRSYGVREDDGSFGSFCLYQSVDAQSLLEHAERAGLPATEITPVLGRIQFREERSTPAGRLPA